VNAPIKHTDPLRALSFARFWAMKQTPYLAQAILSMVPREVPLGTLTPLGGSQQGTLAMNDQGILLYEREALLRWTTPEAGSVLIHEVLHWIRKHGARAKAIGVKPTTRSHWQVAVDMEINDDLHAMKLPLPDGGGLHPRQEKLEEGLIAEAYYQQLLAKYPEQPRPRCTSCGGGSAAGIRIPCEPDEQGRSADGSIDLAARAQAEVEMMRAQVAQAVQAHVEQHGVGSVPLGLQRWAAEVTKPPKVPWREKLRRLAQARISFRPGSSRATYAIKARRQAGLGYGLGAPQLTARVAQKPEVVLAIDTSGSMGQAEVERAVIEAEAVLKLLGHPVRFIACDAAVHAFTEVRNARELVAALRGGGGTDFRPVFSKLQNAKPKIDVLIFITDGGGVAPATAPREYQVIWVLVGKHRCTPMTPSGGKITWGDVVDVDD